jgi:hypothetical protein
VNWLSDSWKILFEGVGGTAVVALIGYVCKRLFESSKQPTSQNTTLKAKGSKVSDSPVASGSGITQNVNSPTIHVNLPPPAPAPVAARQPEPARVQREVPTSQLIVTVTRVAGVGQTGPTQWTEVAQHPRYQGILIQFTNEAVHGGRNFQPVVRASLVYRDEQNELLRIIGGWIDEATDLAAFRVEESHRLILGVLIGEELVAMGLSRTVVGWRSEVCNMDPHPLRGLRQGTVRVRLTESRDHTLLYEGNFDIGTDPLRISPHHPPD